MICFFYLFLLSFFGDFFSLIEGKGFYGVNVDEMGKVTLQKLPRSKSNSILLDGKEITAWNYSLVYLILCIYFAI
jgi:hypothetical protein